MPKEYNDILKHNHGEKSMKVPFIAYADSERLLKKVDTYHNNPEKSSTTKKISINPLVVHCLNIVRLMLQKINLIIIEAKIYMKNFCKDLREHGIKIIDCEKQEMIPLRGEKNKSYHKQKVCYMYKKNLVLIIMIKNTIKVQIIVILLETVEVLLIILVI